ncbi:MAG: CHASE2 domain-containing protein [Cyanobacteria bacterium P01_A01_bin.123]
MNWSLPKRFRYKAARSHRWRWLLPGLVLGCFVVSLWGLGLLTSLDQLTLNGLLRARGPIDWDTRVVVVTVDDGTLGELGRFPIDRRYYTRLTEQLTAAKSSVIGFNILFPDSSPDDQDFAKAIAAHGRVVLGQIWDVQGADILPNPTLRNVAAAVGHLRQLLDNDGITRRVELTSGEVVAFGVEVAQVYSLVSERLTIPNLDEMWVNWPGDVANVAQYSMAQVLAGTVPLQAFQDKIVLVGVTATGLDPLSTPYNFQPPVGGVYLHAAVINTLLHENWLRQIRPGIYIFLVGTTGVLLGYGLRDRSFGFQIGIGIAIAVGWLGLSFILLLFNVWFPAVALVLLSLLLVTFLIGLDRLQARALLQVRNEFFSTMSHEIRTPMNAIIGMAELLRETPMTADQREFTETIYTSGQTLLTLINDILDFSKIESGKFELEYRPVQLSICIEQSLELVTRRASEKQLELAYLIEPAIQPMFLGDDTRLRQILINLLSNAVKFTSTGAVTIHARINRLKPLPRQRQLQTSTSSISQRPKPDSTPHINKGSPLYALRIDVKDTGIGIDSEQIETLFQPYTQASQSTSRRYGGTGLGLAICRQLVKAMGGKIWADSIVGQGTTFSFAIPVLTDDTTVVKSLDQPDARLLGHSLGVIEPHPVRQSFLTQQATLWGMDVQILASDKTGWAALSQAPALSAVIINIDAIAALDPHWMTQLRQASQKPALPVLMLSYSQPSAAILTLTPITVLHKPLKRQVLFDALVQAVQQPSGERAAGELASPLPVTSALTSTLHLSLTLDRPLKILLAEDNLVNQKVTLRMLQRLDLSADIVASGKQALEALSQTSYDLILMDMRMPEMDGIEATRKIRDRGDDTPYPWIIAMTANAADSDRQSCLAAGMNDYLSKPIRLNRLTKVLQHAADSLGALERAD